MSTDRAQPRRFEGILVDMWGLPVTTLTCVVALALTFVGWSNIGYEPFVIDGRALHGEPWRLLSANFVHGDPLHLIFNLYWTWIFGQLLEPRLGSARFLGLVLFLAVGVSLSCHAFDQGGIGLSGIGYGLWALLALGGRRAPALRGLLDRRTNILFVVWFFACIVLTLSNVWLISNWGHASGALLGAAVALLIEPDARLKPARWFVPVGILLVLGCCATVARVRVNFGAGARVDAHAGYMAIERKEWPAACSFLESAVRIDPGAADSWVNLAYVHEQLGDRKASAEAAFRAFQLGKRDAQSLDWLLYALATTTAAEVDAARFDSALEWARRSVEVAPDSVPVWQNVLMTAKRAGDTKWVERSKAELGRLSPSPK